MPDSAGEITRLLDAMRAGDGAAESRLMEAVYPELRKIAARYLQRERVGHTLQPTALVNEAYLQLLGNAGAQLRNRSHFFAAAARSMRRILVDYARMRKAAKREGNRQRIELLDVLAISEDRLEEMIALDEALDKLAAFDPRQGRVVELRFFAGLTEDETAEVMGIAPRTVSREWNVARAWLHGELNGPRAATSGEGH
jgi:RNA polymerase sigma factor (TIGR02999 family)